MFGVAAQFIVGVATAAELDASALRDAEWRRDVQALVHATVVDADLPLLARALGRQRDGATLAVLAQLAGQSAADVRREALDALGRTPGGLPGLRVALAQEADAEVRAVGLAALGRAGDAADLGWLVSLTGGPDGVAAAFALGDLARRGFPLDPTAVGALCGQLDPLRPLRARAAAYAIGQAARAGVVVPPVAQGRLAEAWSQLVDPEARAWLVPALLQVPPGPERRARVHALLSGPWALARQAAIPVLDARDLSPDGWRELLDTSEVWTRARAEARLGLVSGEAGSPEEAVEASPLRAAVVAGTASPAERASLLAEVLRDASPVRRSLGVAALLPGASSAELRLLAMSDDPVVRELVAGVAGAAPDVCGALVAQGGPSATMVAVLDACARGPKPDAPVVRAVSELAATGGFGVTGAAARALAAWGVAATAARPSPEPAATFPGVDRLPVGALVHTTRGDLAVRFDVAAAPLAVWAFATLAEEGSLDGLSFHRVVPGVAAQSGDPRGDGMGGADWLLPDEPSTLPFDVGALGWARSAPDRGSGQWFVTTSAQPELAGELTRFGVVVRGLGVLERLAEGDRVLSVQLVAVSP